MVPVAHVGRPPHTGQLPILRQDGRCQCPEPLQAAADDGDAAAARARVLGTAASQARLAHIGPLYFVYFVSHDLADSLAAITHTVL